ncbi:unnamed protein product, partial [Meganyctiphanes norvegica]
FSVSIIAIFNWQLLQRTAYPIKGGKNTCPTHFGWPFGPAIAFWPPINPWLALNDIRGLFCVLEGQAECYCWPEGPAKGCRTSDSAAVKGIWRRVRDKVSCVCESGREKPGVNALLSLCTI